MGGDRAQWVSVVPTQGVNSGTHLDPLALIKMLEKLPRLERRINQPSIPRDYKVVTITGCNYLLRANEPVPSVVPSNTIPEGGGEC